MNGNISDVIGYRGEKIVELCLANYAEFEQPLFRPGFLGDKWPAIDFYVELIGVRDRRFYFFGQAKSTTSALTAKSKHLKISTSKRDIAHLLQLPGPTYLFAIHEPSKRVFVRSVHQGTPVRAMTRIPLEHELTGNKMESLHSEVREFWATHQYKPLNSVFA